MHEEDAIAGLQRPGASRTAIFENWFSGELSSRTVTLMSSNSSGVLSPSMFVYMLALGR